MEELGIKLQVHYIPIHLQPFYKREYGFTKGDFPKAENFYQRSVSIPLYSSLTDAELEMIVGNHDHFCLSELFHQRIIVDFQTEQKELEMI